MTTEIKRCIWPGAEDKLMIKYHDKEWGVPVHNDKKHFEFLVLDAFQAGLNWRTILYKRENFKKAFANFDYRKVAKFGNRDYDRLMKDEGIIRNRAKISATIENAKRFIDVQKEFGTFDDFIWQFTDYKTIHGKCKSEKDYRAKSPESDEMSSVLKDLGFKFVGSTICYAYMQAAGMVNDHMVTCFRYKELK